MLLEASGDDLESILPPVRTLESEVEDGRGIQDSLNLISLNRYLMKFLILNEVLAQDLIEILILEQSH